MPLRDGMCALIRLDLGQALVAGWGRVPCVRLHTHGRSLPDSQTKADIRPGFPFSSLDTPWPPCLPMCCTHVRDIGLEPSPPHAGCLARRHLVCAYG